MNSSQTIRGSRHGTQYDGTTFANPGDPAEPLHGGGVLPRLPDIDAELARNGVLFVEEMAKLTTFHTVSGTA
ncbi:hypothetical protein ACIBK8_33595 [Streptomyces sp. NPDC050161]|uniref:hypothetical protein n=1 Tax=Streptomyces sp. NPDC050161 TaxID=3365604 RepID=UPI0037AC3909